MAHKILVVDDEPNLVDTVRAYLEDSGYAVVTARTGREALFANRHEHPDLIVMDLMMPEVDGWEATRLIRRESSVPIIMLTARVEDADKIAGLELGADDYVPKPFNPRELVARVRAVLRRAQGELSGESEVLRVGGLELDRTSYQATLDGQPLDLTPSEFDLLAALMSQPGRVFTRMELLDHVQGEAYAAYERTIDVHVKNLRAKIEDDPRSPQYIETVYGVGYRMARRDA
jgi:two-component system alkaline phosphatase synthesis response regulator PhoP